MSILRNACIPILFLAGCGARSGLDASGGATAAGGLASTGGASAAGGVASTGSNQATGCTGSFETLQSSTGLCVAKMTAITAPNGYPNYAIDVTEVTKGQYDAWLATHPAFPPKADANCGYVTTYRGESSDLTYRGPDAEHHPVVWVDWCGAYSYCKGVGKRLCGAISGGSNAYTEYADASASQWHRACSSAGTYTYPYGNTYNSTYCDGYDYRIGNGSLTGQTITVASLGSCVTSTNGYAGVYDLSGNVREWEDSCISTGQLAACRLRGGAFWDQGPLTCGREDSDQRSSAAIYIGFRCCSQ